MPFTLRCEPSPDNRKFVLTIESTDEKKVGVRETLRVLMNWCRKIGITYGIKAEEILVDARIVEITDTLRDKNG